MYFRFCRRHRVSHNGLNTDTVFEYATWRITHRDSPGGAAKLRARGTKSAIAGWLVAIAEREDGREAQVGVEAAGEAAQRHRAGESRGLRAVRHRQASAGLCAQQPRPEGQDAPHRLPAPGGQGLAARSRHGDPVSRHPAGEHRRRASGEVAVLLSSGTLRQSAAYERDRARTRPLPGQLHSQLRYVVLPPL